MYLTSTSASSLGGVLGLMPTEREEVAGKYIVLV